MLVTLVLLPSLAGLVVWIAGDGRAKTRAVVSVGVLGMAVVLAAAVAGTQPSASTMRWGSGLTLRLEVAAIGRMPVVMVAFVGMAVVTYALGYGDERGRSRMVGLLVAFVGVMELLVLAGDMLTLLIAWELVGLVSWGLIAHHWRGDAVARATHAFLATRAGDLGLFVAAGAAFAATGSLDFAHLGSVSGGLAATIAGGVLVAAAAKSAQVPFSPWLFSAMAGPTPVSALLHAATMVAAGAYLLARLQPFLDTVGWFGPLTIGIGLVTALAGGVVALVHGEAKKVLAASTSAHYGLMFVAVGTGYPGVAVAHLVAHGLFKALLFISAGVAVDAAGTEQLAGMRVGRRVPLIAGLALVGTLALAAVPPLGAAWTKEKVVAAAVHDAPWIGALVIVAGGLSAAYAVRFQLVVFGARRDANDAPPFGHALAALSGLAAASVALGVVWLPWGEARLASLTKGVVPPGTPWELAGSLAVVAIGVCVVVVLDRRGRLAVPFATPVVAPVADWLGLPALVRVGVTDRVLAAARVAARFDDGVVDRGIVGAARAGTAVAAGAATGDDRVVDAGVRGVARLGAWLAAALDRVGEASFAGAVVGLARVAGLAGRGARRLQSGQTHVYYSGIAAGIALLVAAAFVWS